MTTAYDLAPNSRVLLEGTTNIGAWSCCSSQARARVVLNLDDSTLRTRFDRLQSGHLPAGQLRLSPACLAIADLSVPVTSLHGDSFGMDRDMRSALKARQYPLIQYRLEKVQIVQMQQDPITGQPGFLLHVVGNLIVAGVERTLASDLFVRRDASQHYLLHAQTFIRMTDFGVTPPTALFDFLRARDSLSVIFDLQFVPSRGLQGAQQPVQAHRLLDQGRKE